MSACQVLQRWFALLRTVRFDARSVVNLNGFVVSTQSYNHNSPINCILCYVFVLSRSFGENVIFSKAVRQNLEWRAWVWGYVWPPLKLGFICFDNKIYRNESNTIQLLEHPLFQEKWLIKAFKHPHLKLLFQYPNTYILRSLNGGCQMYISLRQFCGARMGLPNVC